MHSYSELWHFLFVTSRLVTANVSPQLFWESLCHQRLTYIQYSRYVYGTPNLPPFCLTDSPNLAKSCTLAILAESDFHVGPDDGLMQAHHMYRHFPLQWGLLFLQLEAESYKP
eukprot:COSAG01_NODE_10_length_42970_cov_93.010007_5_plen_113_part_00